LVTATAKTSSSDIEPKIEIIRERPPIPFNPWWIVTSFLLTVFIAIFLYIIPDYLFLEKITRDLVLIGLNLLGIDSNVAGFSFPLDSQPEFKQFGEAYPNTPGIVITSRTSDYSAFWIVKACTGMQAGAILIALIVVTPIPDSKNIEPNKLLTELSFRKRLRTTHPLFYSILHKLVVIGIFFMVLFVANTIRITFHLWLVGLGYPFSFAHDDLSKPIGFIGTLIFAYVIEKSGIPIIDTFADWLDASYYGLKSGYKRIMG
jgi:hypothetical protein